MTYGDKDAYAVKRHFADWDAYTAELATPTEAELEDDLEENTITINQIIGSYNADITDTRWAGWLAKLCVRMTLRMNGVSVDRDRGTFAPYSLADFLNARERSRLESIGRTLGYRVRAKLVF